MRSINYFRRKYLLFFLLLSPAVVIIAAVIGYPMIHALYSSFYRFSFARPYLGRQFVGLKNYLDILSDPEFISSLFRSLVFTISAVWLQVAVGFLIALVFYYASASLKIFKTIVTIPVFLAPIVVGYIWRFILNVDFGFISSVFRAIGLQPISFLGSTSLALPTIILVNTWQHTPFAILLYLAGFAGLNKETFDAAEIDGATTLQTVWYITIPLLKRVTAVIITIRTYSVFKVFEEIFVLTEGGPAQSTSTLTYYLYQKGFVLFETGSATAVSIIMLAIVIIIILINLKLIGE